MKIVALSMIGNEADIVECFVRHTLTLVDRLVVILHRSVDGTAEIVSALKAEGLALEIERAWFAGFSQGAELTRAAKSLLAHADPAVRADYVVLLDADEFLKVPSQDYLYRALPAVPGGFYAAARWQNYLPMRAEDLANTHSLRAITHCREDDPPPYYKAMLNPNFLEHRASVCEGMHCVMWESQGSHKPAPLIELKAIRLAHFPVRSSFQLARKAHIGVLAKRLKSEGVAGGLGAHWQGLREQFDTHAEIGFERLRSIAFHYPQTFGSDVAIDERVIADSPIACSFELRYTLLMRTNLEDILADWGHA